MIIALDLGQRMGAAIGAPGHSPDTVAVSLKRANEHRSRAFANLVAWLDDRIQRHRPTLIFREKMLPLQAFRNLGNAEATVRLQSGMHAIVEGVCGRYGIRCEEASDATIRKHFIGIGRIGTRGQTKAAVLARCHQLSLLSQTCMDEDVGDAIAAYDYASAVLCARPLPIVLFGART